MSRHRPPSSTAVSSIVLVELSCFSHSHEADAVLLEPLVANLLGGHEHMPDAGLGTKK